MKGRTHTLHGFPSPGENAKLGKGNIRLNAKRGVISMRVAGSGGKSIHEQSRDIGHQGTKEIH